MGAVTDGFGGCLVADAWVRRARTAFRDLPPEVAQHPALAQWLASAVRHYWSVALHPDVDEVERDVGPPARRDVGAVLSAIAHLRRALGRLPRTSLRREEYLAQLDALETDVRRHLGRKRRTGPRRDHWRCELEANVALELARAGVPLTTARSGALARTLVAIYKAAGIRAPEQDSIFRTLKRLVDHHRGLAALVTAG